MVFSKTSKQLLRICILLIGLAQTVAQLYGNNACPNGNPGYCGTNGGITGGSTCTDEQNNNALTNWIGYFSGFSNPANNYAQSMAFTTGAGQGSPSSPNYIPPFTFNWHGSTNLIPIAGSYVGANALGEFFGAANTYTANVQFNPAYAPDSVVPGVFIPAFNCQFLIAQWQEMSQARETGKPITYSTNTVRYTFLNQSYPYIAVADVWVDDGIYQNAYCPGQVNCDGYNNVSQTFTCNEYSQSLSQLYGILIAVLVLVIFALLGIIIGFAKFMQGNSIASKSGGTRNTELTSKNPMN